MPEVFGFCLTVLYDLFCLYLHLLYVIVCLYVTEVFWLYAYNGFKKLLPFLVISQ